MLNSPILLAFGLLIACTDSSGRAQIPMEDPSTTTVPTTSSSPTTSPTTETSTLRVPAEWEPQEAVWLQWPQFFESTYEPAFAQIVTTILGYEDVHILVHNQNTENSARSALGGIGGLPLEVINGDPNEAGYTLTWHDIPNDSAWMRDNGPRYVIQDGEMRIQNWRFDGWGGAFGDFPTANDNDVPDAVASYLQLPSDRVDIVHERGDLEFNGSDAVILNWTVIGDPNRNPGITQDEVTTAMEEHFGVSRVVLVEGAPSGDLTGGHIDGMARFITEDQVVVADCSDTSHCQPGGPDDLIYDNAATQLADAGFEVIRFPFAAEVTYRNATFDTDYMNWLVGNGFVITVGFEHPEADAAAQAQIEEWFPGRDVYVIDMLESWYNGGGVHCHTNDQPSL